MATFRTSPTTDFALDVIGRYVCGGLDEAKSSAERMVTRPDRRPQIEGCDTVVIGEGAFRAMPSLNFHNRKPGRGFHYRQMRADASSNL